MNLSTRSEVRRSVPECLLATMGGFGHLRGMVLPVEELRSRLEKPTDEGINTAATAEADPLAGLKELPLDRVVTLYLNSRHSLTGAIAEGPGDQMVLFEPRTGTSCQYHMVPFTSISAWSDMRGENAEPLFLYGREYLTRQKISEKERSRAGVCS